VTVGEADGLVTIVSRHSVPDTIAQLRRVAEAKGFTVYAEIDHAANAAAAGLHLRPMQVVIFGNPAMGTALIHDVPSTGLDLPLRALAWEDDNGEVWLTYNDPSWLADRYDLSEDCKTAVRAMMTSMSALARGATET
jgi:uncharacterized protein (DUF302 family)